MQVWGQWLAYLHVYVMLLPLREAEFTKDLMDGQRQENFEPVFKNISLGAGEMAKLAALLQNPTTVPRPTLVAHNDL